MPAPAPESEPAIVSATGGFTPEAYSPLVAAPPAGPTPLSQRRASPGHAEWRTGVSVPPPRGHQNRMRHERGDEVGAALDALSDAIERNAGDEHMLQGRLAGLRRERASG